MAYQIRLLRKDTIARGTVAFTFEKPEGYSYQAGQATDWSLIDPTETDDEGTSRSFTIAIAPSSETLRIATRMRDTAFKRQLGAMPIGAKIQIDDPWGEFTIDANDSAPLVFLCGGIGITPFLSMLEESVKKNSTRSMTLLYSNKQPNDVPFRTELLELAAPGTSRTMIETMTEATNEWRGERGFIDWPMIERHVGDPFAARFMIAGPPAMVAAMKAMLLGGGVPEQMIVLDDFFGY